MKILLATHNQSKFARYKRILSPISDLEIFSLSDLGIADKVEENFNTNAENALHKAKSYAKIAKDYIVVAVDEALMTNFLPDNEQPGVYARRFSEGRKELTDEELIEVWKKIFKMYPQDDKKFIWDFAIAYYNPKTSSEGFICIEEISYIASEFSSMKTNGYPMSTLLTSTRGGRAYVEMSEEEKMEKDVKNFAPFSNAFKNWIEQF
jgi:inosine/xanthosine triphosphate pyrophosphatase family protein